MHVTVVLYFTTVSNLRQTKIRPKKVRPYGRTFDDSISALSRLRFRRHGQPQTAVHGLFHCPEDVLIAGAAAQVAGDELAQLLPGVLLAGVNTYSYIFEHWGGWPYKSKKTFVVSHCDPNVTKKENVTFLTDMPLRAINELKSSSETDIQVIGGGKFITSLIEASLLDEITLYIVPVMLGDGIKFIGKTFGSKWELTGHRVIDNQVVCLTYQYKGE